VRRRQELARSVAVEVLKERDYGHRVAADRGVPTGAVVVARPRGGGLADGGVVGFRDPP
jgi:hypothetical protein